MDVKTFDEVMDKVACKTFANEENKHLVPAVLDCLARLFSGYTRVLENEQEKKPMPQAMIDLGLFLLLMAADNAGIDEERVAESVVPVFLDVIVGKEPDKEDISEAPNEEDVSEAS